MSLWFNNIIFCTNVIFWTNILCTEKACAYSLYLLATNPSGASTTLVIHMPHVCQTLRTGLLLWNSIPDTKLSAAVPIGHLPGTCFFKCSRVVVSKQSWLRGELTAVPSLEHGKQREKQWLWCARKAHHHTGHCVWGNWDVKYLSWLILACTNSCEEWITCFPTEHLQPKNFFTYL